MRWPRFAKGGYKTLTPIRKPRETIATLAETALWFQCDKTPAVVYVNGVEFRPCDKNKDAGK